MPQEQKPAWQVINDLFAKHGLPAPPTRLRDELVSHLIAYRHAMRTDADDLPPPGVGTADSTLKLIREQATALVEGRRV